MSKIDWTKPIEWCCGGRSKPAELVATHNGFRIVCRNGSYGHYNENGTYMGGGIPYIRNVPPPKIEKTVVLLLWHDGSCGIREVGWEPKGEWATRNLRAKKTITITEGEGL